MLILSPPLLATEDDIAEAAAVIDEAIDAVFD
jgi:adenosylmethionine-8-amino-7-oxononanoate aminotransferase